LSTDFHPATVISEASPEASISIRLQGPCESDAQVFSPNSPGSSFLQSPLSPFPVCSPFADVINDWLSPYLSPQGGSSSSLSSSQSQLSLSPLLLANMSDTLNVDGESQSALFSPSTRSPSTLYTHFEGSFDLRANHHKSQETYSPGTVF
jgi:hypothetical protein